jgi:hypothetical protein
MSLIIKSIEVAAEKATLTEYLETKNFFKHIVLLSWAAILQGLYKFYKLPSGSLFNILGVTKGAFSTAKNKVDQAVHLRCLRPS